MGQAIDATTDHALLVLLGQYAQHLGLIDRLQGVPIGQRTREHILQTKLIQFLTGVLAGLEHLQDFNDGPQPLVKDRMELSGMRWTVAGAKALFSPALGE